MKKEPFILAVSGVKNSGKTTLITKLLPLLTKKGWKVAVIKHDGHEFDADVPGTDSYRHMEAGAYGTAVFSKSKYMVVKREPSVCAEQLLECFPEADIILLEGFKHSEFPKLEIIRRGNTHSLQPDCLKGNNDSVKESTYSLKENEKLYKSVCAGYHLLGILSDLRKEEIQNVPENVCFLDLNDIEAVAEYISAKAAAGKYSMIILAGGMSRRMGTDKANLLYHGKSFLEIQIEKGRTLGIKDILVSGYRGNICKEDQDVRVIPDRFSKKGPLGGLEACLREAIHERSLVLSVDVPLVPTEELEKLLDCSTENNGKITILKHGEKEQPLIGVYHRDVADAMCKEIEEEKGSVFAFINRNGYQVYESLAEDAFFRNINDMEAYREIK